MREITLGSLFDGIGGFPYAASFYGIRSLWASEVEPSCVSVTQKHFPDMAHVGNVTRLDGAKLPPVDIITFGSPCQGLSLAGQRRGLADERSGLFLEAIRIIFEMREATHGRYPRFALFENVPGALSSAGGRDYQIVLQSFTKTEVPIPRSGKWADAGMVRGGGADLAWCVYDAQYFGTAQRRRRLFLVCAFGGRRAGEILFVPKSLRGYFETGGTPRQGLTTFTADGAGASGGTVAVLNDQGGNSINVERSGLSPTLRSQTHGNLPIIAAGFDLQQITSKTNRSTLKPVQPTLCRTSQSHIVAGMLCMGTSQANASILDDQSPTLTCAHGQAPILIHPQNSVLKAYSIGAYYSKGMLSSNPTAGIREADTSRTLDLNGGNPACQQGGIAVVGGDLRDWVLIVRRLMPIEAERLMGFPDFWTESGLDGKPISDTKRYAMLGNSIATPCAAYIMQGIREAME